MCWSGEESSSWQNSVVCSGVSGTGSRITAAVLLLFPYERSTYHVEEVGGHDRRPDGGVVPIGDEDAVRVREVGGGVVAAGASGKQVPEMT